MSDYDYQKAIQIIEENKNDLISASLGMAEDWSWTADTVFENGEFVIDLSKEPYIAGINGSYWATPSIMLEFKNGEEKLHPCFKGESSGTRPGMSLLGPLSAPVQNALPELEEYTEKKSQSKD